MAIPCLALGTIDCETDAWPFLRVLLRGCAARRLHVQTFLSQAVYGGFYELKHWSGATPRHLDSWLMSRRLCRALFVRGTARADLALVLGQYESPYPNGGAADRCSLVSYGAGSKEKQGPSGNSRTTFGKAGMVPRTENAAAANSLVTGPCRDSDKEVCQGRGRSWVNPRGQRGNFGLGQGGRLETLCDWLGLLRLAVVRTALMDCAAGAANLPKKLDAVFLIDADPRVSPLRYSLDFQMLFGVPVIGVFYRQPLANEFDGDDDLWEDGRFRLWWNERFIQELALRSGEGPVPDEDWPIDDYCGRVTIAIARDNVFDCCFPEVLEAFERSGARILDFSPLLDERLPEETDIVYLGCGDPSGDALRLANNHCLKMAIRNHVRRGGRIYAEGAGAAYLGQWMEIAPSSFVRGVGLLPVSARRLPRFGNPLPISLALQRPTWLVDAGETVRGYRNAQWWFQPESIIPGSVTWPGFEYDILGDDRVFASLIHIDLAAQPELLQRFFALPRETVPCRI